MRIEQLEARQMMHADGIEHAHDDVPLPPITDQAAALAAVSPNALLPDLIPWVDESKGFLYGWTVQGNLLRLTTAMANNGVGPLEIRGGAIIGENIQEVHQRIYEPDGTFTDVVAGSFTYHPEHKHIHFDGFAEFRLREVLPDGGVGALVAGGLKTSFCIIDIEQYDSEAGEATYLTCKQVQGLSPGWADLYDKGLPGQSIDITDVQNGTYWLEMAVDPDGHITESNEDNNVERILIDLQRSGAPTDADTFETNDSITAASILAPPEDHLYEDLSIHAAGNSDYYRVTASATGKLSVSIDFQHSAGNINLAIYNANQKKLVGSNTKSNTEKVTVDAEAGDIFYIHVFGKGNATNPNYSMFVDQPEADDEESGDAFEDNDTFATAKSLTAIDQVYDHLSVLRSNDDDYYRIVATDSGALAVSLDFLNSQGDLELAVYDAAQTELAISETAGDGEQVRIPVTAGQAYYIRVWGVDGETNPEYSMTVDMIEPGESTVYYLSTSGGGTLTSTNGSPSLSFADSDILKLTVMGNGLYGYELFFDGSDVGLTTAAEDIDAFAFRADGSILISTVGSYSVPAAGGGTLTGGGQQILLFTPTSLSDETSGEWSLFFDGADVALAAAAENIDAIAELSDGSLLISTTGAFKVPGLSAADEDLLRFVPTSLGSTTAGDWSLYFDGSDVALKANDAEDVNALFVRETGGTPKLYFSTVGNFSVSGVSGANDDVVEFNPTSLGDTTAGSFGPGLELDGSVYGLASHVVDGISLDYPLVMAQATSFRAVEQDSGAGAVAAEELVFASFVTPELPQSSAKPKENVASKSTDGPSSSNALQTETKKSAPAKKQQEGKKKESKDAAKKLVGSTKSPVASQLSSALSRLWSGV